MVLACEAVGAEDDVQSLDVHVGTRGGSICFRSVEAAPRTQERNVAASTSFTRTRGSSIMSHGVVSTVKKTAAAREAGRMGDDIPAPGVADGTREAAASI